MEQVNRMEEAKEIKETVIRFFYEDLVRAYGQERAEVYYASVCGKYKRLCEKEAVRSDDAMNEHIFKRLLPAAGLYLSLIENGFTREEAFSFASREIQRDACEKAAENAKFTRLPFSYALFRLFAKSHMKKNYPAEGFSVAWRKIDAESVDFDITRCVYKDLCEKYACPELCSVFCHSDVVAFAGYEPKLKFARARTIAEGAGCCDFHFIRGKLCT